MNKRRNASIFFAAVFVLICGLGILQQIKINKLNGEINKFENPDPVGTYTIGDPLTNLDLVQYFVFEHDGTYCRYIPHANTAGDVQDTGTYSKCEALYQDGLYELHSDNGETSCVAMTGYGVYTTAYDGVLRCFRKTTDIPTYANYLAPG